MDLTFFNPRSQSEADFIASFVARVSTLEFFVRQLRQLSQGKAASHQLIVAPRGFGKTSLLRRIAIAVRAEDALRKRYLPLSFREEQHNVISLDVFWRNCLQSLLEAREEEQASDLELDGIDAAWARLTPRQTLPRDAQDGDPAWQEFNQRCIQLGRRPILLIDNLDTLLAGLGKDHQWALREMLQRSDGPVVIAAASRYPESTHDQNAAFYDFFRIQTLNRLENPEVLLCLRTLAHHRGEAGKPVLVLLDSDPGRVAALNTMAGGNPRTLGVLYGVLESHMSTDVLSQLSAMLDTFTGWYQARTEELPMQARAVFDALALNWDPMTAAAAGQATGLETVVVSSQLSRLEKLGYVEAVALSHRGKGRSGFQVVERFFNIWYLMRNGPRRARQSIKFLTVFLQSCFSAPERRSLGRRVLGVAGIDPGYALALASTFRGGRMRERLLQKANTAASQLIAASEYQAVIRSMQLPPTRPADVTDDQMALDNEPQSELSAKLQTGQDLMTEGRNAEAIVVFDGVLSRWGQASDLALRESIALALDNKGFCLGQLGRVDEAIAVYDSVLSRFDAARELTLRRHVAQALYNKGVALGQLGRTEEEIAVYDSVLSRFGEASEVGLREQVANALVNKGVTLGQLGRSEEGIAVYDSVLSLFGEASEPALQEQIARALVNTGNALGRLGQSEKAVAVYDSVLSQFGTARELPLREQVAFALVNKGVTLGQLGQSEKAVAVYDSVFSRFGTALELPFREQVANALVNKGVTLSLLGRSEDAIAVFDSMLSRFGEARELGLREQVANALVNKGVTLGQLGRIEEAIAVYDSVLNRFGEASELGLREQIAQALVNKGVTLGQLGRSEEEIAVYDSVVGRFGEASELALREQVANSLVNKGITLGQLGRGEEEIAVYDSVLSRFGVASELALHEQIAQALLNKGFTLGQLGRSEEGIAVYDSLLSRFNESSELDLQIAQALVNKGFILVQLGRIEEGIAVYESVLSRFGEASELPLREGVARALVNKGSAFGRLGRSEEAIAIYDSVLSRFGEASELPFREQVASALVNKGITLGLLGRNEDEIAAYDSVLSRFGEARELALREQIAKALLNKSVALRQLGRNGEDIAVYNSMLSRFGESRELALREMVVRVEMGRANFLLEFGQVDEAEVVLRSGIKRLPKNASLWNSLGNLLLDAKGDPAGAVAAYLQGLAVANSSDNSAMLNANCAYVLALHMGDKLRAQEHIQYALAADAMDFTVAGRHLLAALLMSNQADAVDWSAMFKGIGRAVESGDAGLWTNFMDDLQRLLWFVIAHQRGNALREWMDAEDYPLRQAPLYHAVVAAIEGEEHLLVINPETRAPAKRIFDGIARRLQLYAVESKKEPHRRTRGT